MISEESDKGVGGGFEKELREYPAYSSNENWSAGVRGDVLSSHLARSPFSCEWLAVSHLCLVLHRCSLAIEGCNLVKYGFSLSIFFVSK